MRVFLKLPRIFSSLLLVSLILPIGVGYGLPTDKVGSSSFELKISRLLNQKKFEAGFWGLHIVSLRDNRVLFSLNAKKHFLPASNMKLIIGAAALDALGPDFRFETPVYVEGRIDPEGKLQGNLILVGNGNPNLEARMFQQDEEYLPRNASLLFIERLADQIADRGIRGVEGDIVADDTAFLYEPYAQGWEHDDLQWAYGAPVSALAVNENAFSLEVWPGEAVGDPARIKIFPLFEGLTLVNQVATVGLADQPSIGIKCSLEKNRVVIQGELARGHAKLDYALAVSDPAEFAALLLKAALEQRGISVSGKAVARHLHPLEILEKGKPSLALAKTLLMHYLPEQKIASNLSVALIETLKIMMKVSHNLYAEMLLRKLGAEAAGIGSIESGVAAVKCFLENTGTPPEELNLSDGSGLSRTDLVTPESLARLLLFMDKHPQKERFLETLPVAGLDGTLKNRMRKTSAAGNIHAKTGTSNLVTALSGYARGKNGEKLAFSIMANNHTVPTQEVRDVIDQICVLMADYDPSRKKQKNPRFR